MKLDVKVLDYINQHQQGVRISEMEIPLCETRMKIGFIVKSLYEEGKILKIDNTYFPKNMRKEEGIDRSPG